MISTEQAVALMQKAVRMFYLQRCGTALPPEYADDFAHPVCHAAPSRIFGSDATADVTGGWHDAGDYGRYVVPAAKAVADLLLAYETVPELFSDRSGIPESGNGVPDILDEARWEIEWMLKMMRPDGAVYHKVTCARFCGMVPPHMEQEETIISPVSTASTGDFAGALAVASRIFRNHDRSFSETCLRAARLACAFLASSPPLSFHNPTGIETGEYGDECDADERFFAAAALYAATGEPDFLAGAKTPLADNPPLSLGWEDMAGYGYLACMKNPRAVESGFLSILKERLLHEADRLAGLSETHPFGLSLEGELPWGSNMYLLNNAILLGEANGLQPSQRYVTALRKHLDYVLGNNPLAMCYVTGIGDRSPQHPHHRPSAAVGKPVPGMLVGGPDSYLHDPRAKELLTGRPPMECYLDDLESYSTNEVAIYWNSALVYALALYLDSSEHCR